MNNQDPFVIFNSNIERATDFLMLAELKEFRTKLSISVIEQFRPVRQLINKWTSKMYRVGLPQILVYSVSCLDACIKNHYYNLYGTKIKHNEKIRDVNHISFQRSKSIQEAFEYHHIKIFEDEEEHFLEKKLNKIVKIRNDIVHEGRNHSLDVETVKDYINTIKNSVQLIQQKTSHLEEKIIP